MPELQNTSSLQVWRKLFFHRSRSPARSKNEEGRRKRLSGLKKERQKVGLCISGRCATVDQIHVAEGPKILEIQSAFSVHTRRGTFYQNSGKEKDIHSEWFNPRTLMSAVALLESWRIVPKNNVSKRVMCPQSSMGFGNNCVKHSWKLGSKQSHVLLAFGGLFLRHPP